MMDDGIFVIISLMIMDGSNKGHQNRNRVHSRYKKAFLKSLDNRGRRIRQREIPRCCLHSDARLALKIYCFEGSRRVAVMRRDASRVADFMIGSQRYVNVIVTPHDESHCSDAMSDDACANFF